MKAASNIDGSAWIEAQELLDRMFKPFENLLMESVSGRSPRRVLDVGCGTGSTTLALSRLSEHGACGIDISEPMISVARARAEREGNLASFVVADAQSHAFAPASFDAIISRFGVMFFDDPIGAFSNLRRAAVVGADLRCIVWRDPSENPFMTAAEHAAAPMLPDIPTRKPNAPGQFGFADPQHVRGILERSGWSQIEIQPIDVVCSLSEKELVQYMTRLGPLGRALGAVDEATRAQVLTAVRAAFEPYVHGTEVRFNAACWMVAAANH